MILHIISNPQQTKRCFRHVSDGDSIVFAGDGVVSTQRHLKADTYALALDLEARSITLPIGVQEIDTALMVDLVVRHKRTITWS